MTVTTVFAGVANVLVTDGTSSILVDGFFSRPSLTRTIVGRLRPSRPRIEEALDRLGADRLDSVLVSHSHFDHALDAPVVADMTGAELVGTPSTRMIACGYGLDRVPFREMRYGQPFTVGAFTVTPVYALHSVGDKFPGEITEPVTLPAKAKDLRTGGCASFHFAHADGTVFVHPTANFIPGDLTEYSADLVYLGGGAAGARSVLWIEEYWHETVGALSAGVVRPIRWDTFWRSLSKPLRPVPKAVDRLDVTMREFTRLAGTDVDMSLPKPWQRESIRA